MLPFVGEGATFFRSARRARTRRERKRTCEENLSRRMLTRRTAAARQMSSGFLALESATLCARADTRAALEARRVVAKAKRCGMERIISA